MEAKDKNNEFILGTSVMNAFGSVPISHDACYKSSFINMPDATPYYDPWRTNVEGKSSDGRKQLKRMHVYLKSRYDKKLQAIGLKALGPTTGGAGTAGYALVPIAVDNIIIDESRKYTPLVELIRRVSNVGLTADYNVITAKGAAFTANPDGAMNEADNTITRRSKPIKYLYSVGRVLGPAQAAIPPYILDAFQASGSGVGGAMFTSVNAPSAKQLEVVTKARALKELEENLILNGDSSSDATEYDGLIVQQSTTNQYDLAGADLGWGDIESMCETLFSASGHTSLAVASAAAFRKVRTMLIDTFRMAPQDLKEGATLPFGVSNMIALHTMSGTFPMIPSQYLSNTAGSRQIWFFDMNHIEMRVLLEMTYEDLAKTNDSAKFMLKIYECVLNKAPAFSGFIDNIE